MPPKLVAMLLCVLVVRNIFSKSTNPPGVRTASPILMEPGAFCRSLCCAARAAERLGGADRPSRISGEGAGGIAAAGCGAGCDETETFSDVGANAPSRALD